MSFFNWNVLITYHYIPFSCLISFILYKGYQDDKRTLSPPKIPLESCIMNQLFSRFYHNFLFLWKEAKLEVRKSPIGIIIKRNPENVVCICTLSILYQPNTYLVIYLQLFGNLSVGENGYGGNEIGCIICSDRLSFMQSIRKPRFNVINDYILCPDVLFIGELTTKTASRYLCFNVSVN